MPTYHLAVVVDDYLMQITHAFRGEEWLSSAPVHVMLWKYLFAWIRCPLWAHLPLILGPKANSANVMAQIRLPGLCHELDRPKTGELTEGFREKRISAGSVPQPLAMLGWERWNGKRDVQPARVDPTFQYGQGL